MARFLWTEKQDIGPKPRAGHAMTYDSGRSRAILFGGDSLRSRLFNDTWEWDGENWTQMADIGPRSRRDCALAYDSARGRVVLFGGHGDGSGLGDTWEWDGEDWTQVADVGPAPRAAHAMIFDSARDRVVLFGGESTAAALVGDTWEWDGQDWTQQEDTGPAARKAHAMAYDSARLRTVLFGGDAGSGTGLGDTWEWDGTTWTQVADFGPDACLAAAMVFKGDRVALFGGVDSISAPSPRVFGNTWEWDGKHWTQRQDIGPGPRWAHAMAFDSTNNRIVLFGGLPTFAPAGDPALPDRLLGDTWQHAESEPASSEIGVLDSLVLTPSSLSAAPGQTAKVTVKLKTLAPAGGLVVPITALSVPPGFGGPGQPTGLPLATGALIVPNEVTVPPHVAAGQSIVGVGVAPVPGIYRIDAHGLKNTVSAQLTVI